MLPPAVGVIVNNPNTIQTVALDHMTSSSRTNTEAAVIAEGVVYVTTVEFDILKRTVRVLATDAEYRPDALTLYL